MSTQSLGNPANGVESIDYDPDKRFPLWLTSISFLFLYGLQYPLTLLLPDVFPRAEYDSGEWLVAYAFVIISAVIFVFSLYRGMSGRSVKVARNFRPVGASRKPASLLLVVAVFAFFSLWSYVMLKVNVGMTINFDFESRLPFRLAGLLFYGRLLVQPLVLAYLAATYCNSRLKWIMLLLLVALGVWAAMTSGSRFLGIMFAVPMLMLFKGKVRYVAFIFSVLAFMEVASLTRAFYLPYELGDKYVAIYANDETQAMALEGMDIQALTYLITRPMGMGEVLMTFRFGNISADIQESVQSSFNLFFPYLILPGNTATVKNVYGLNDDAFGGYGLDFFSNFWVAMGGSAVLYGLGIGLIGWMLGKSYRLLAIGMTRIGFADGITLMYLLLFTLAAEARVFLVVWLLLAAWVFSWEGTSQMIFELFAKPVNPLPRVRTSPFRGLLRRDSPRT